LVRALLARWYITVTGLLLSLALAAAAYVLFPPQYSSTGTVVLLPASQRGQNSLLNFDSSLNTTALIVVQALNAPQVSTELGLASTDKYTVVNGGASLTGKVNETSGPFISVTARSAGPTESSVTVSRVLVEAQQQLVERQKSLRVFKRDAIGLEIVAGPTPPKLLLSGPLKSMGVTLLLGIGSTVAAACLRDRSAARRRSTAKSRVSEGHRSANGWSPTVGATDPVG